VLDLYIFDRKLRLLTLDAIEKIEVSVKAQIDSVMSTKYGCFWYTDREIFFLNENKSIEIYENFIEIAKAKKEKSTSMFGKAYREKYDEEIFLPSRMLLEECMIGEVSTLCKLLKPDDLKNIVCFYGVYFVDFRKRLQLIVHIRNISAHHSRLWNRVSIVQLRCNDIIFHEKYTTTNNSNGGKAVVSNYFAVVLVIHHLLEKISP
jgi:abortive infection bacteriophage resistance protein